MRNISLQKLFVLAPCIALATGQSTGGLSPPSPTAYSASPLPSNTAYPDSATFVLSDDFEITDRPTTRELFFNITTAAASPDGYARQVYVVNGQLPGPLIEANTGDTIIVHVDNQLDEGQSLHWHGIFQNGSAYMDGVPGVTQCPIPPGGTFTYKFTVANQYGTYWWHSHYGNTLADGLVGPLVVHSVDEPLRRNRDYDEDRVLMISDWIHDQSSVVVEGLRAGTFRGDLPPQGDSILINGIGRTNCSAVPSGTSCDYLPPPEIQVSANKTIRFRVINTSAHSMLRLSIDSHDMEVIEADGTAVYGPTTHEIPIAPAQRYSILVNTTQGQAGDAYWLRTNTALACMPAGHVQTALAVFRYTSGMDSETSTRDPETQAWDDLAGSDAKCRDLDQMYAVAPRDGKAAVNDALQTHFLSSSRGKFVNINGVSFFGFGFDNVSFQNQIYKPLLSDIESGTTLNSSLIRSITFDGIGVGNIVVNNLDANIDHPYHLHGNDFQIIARGNGTLTQEGLKGVSLHLANPLRRDTLWIPGGGYAILRYTTDNPGVWALHCHIGWHLAEGKLAAVVVRPEAIRSFPQPADWSNLCANTNASQFGPARRDVEQVSRIAVSATGLHANNSSATSRTMLGRRGPRET
ncbi:hypothetical protein IAR55_003304 [Kwoniella newhampshirensis]|uniref:Diphenol oxidase n=1 Tax=Kwoniella newhampshirensis TaxID=1651941 RepID=A0AAW0YM56_9TREE